MNEAFGDEIEVTVSARRANQGMTAMLKIEIEREEDGRWISEVPELPGVLAYGATEAEDRAKTSALAVWVIADRTEHGEDPGSRMLAQIARHTGLRPGGL
jgi:predicted RNase H-like HicB family nuclease